MDENELKTLLEGVAKKNGEAIKEAVKDEIEKAAAKLITSDQLGEKLEGMGIKEDAIKSLTDSVEKQGLKINELLHGKASEKTWQEVIAEKHQDIIKAFDSKSRIRISIANKTLVTRASVANNTMAYQIPGIGELQWKAGGIYDLFGKIQVGPNSNGVVRYRDQAAQTFNAAETEEGVQKPESAYTWGEYYMPIEKVPVTIPLTKEAWMDLGFMQGEIDKLMNRDLMLRINSQLYGGDGVTPNLKGVNTYAGAFDNTGFANTVDDANLFDLIAAVRTSIAAVGNGKYTGQFTVIMNPIDIYKYKVAKATDGHYIMPPFVADNGAVIDGVRVIEDANVTANTLVVGNFAYGTIYEIGGVEIDMGYVNAQFIENEFTMLAEKRLGLLIRNADVTGFKKVANITTAIADLETP